MSQTIRIDQLDERVRTFLAKAVEQGGVVVTGTDGTTAARVIPWTKATVEEREAAWADVREIQDKTRRLMEEQGRTEEELDRILREDG